MVPTITALVQMGEEIQSRELQRAFNKLGQLSEHDRKVISSLANAIVNQLLHTPVTQLKNYAATNEGHLYMRMLQNIFNLEVTEQESEKKQ